MLSVSQCELWSVNSTPTKSTQSFSVCEDAPGLFFRVGNLCLALPYNRSSIGQARMSYLVFPCHVISLGLASWVEPLCSTDRCVLPGIVLNLECKTQSYAACNLFGGVVDLTYQACRCEAIHDEGLHDSPCALQLLCV